MAQSIIVQSIIDALSSSDPALLATSTETARIDVNCGEQDPRTPLLSMESILFPKQMRAIPKVIPSGGCIVKQTSSKPEDSDIIKDKIAIFKRELKRKILDKKDLMSVKFEISRLIYDIFVNDDISNETVTNFPNVYLYNYRKEGLLDRPGGELNRRFKKISDFFFIPSDAIFGIFEVIKEAEKNGAINIWTTLFSKISGIAIDFEKFGSPILKTEDNLVKLMIEFIPFFNYTENEIKGQNGATLEPRYHGGYYTIFNEISASPNSNIIVKLPDFTARNYRGNSTSFHEDFQLSGDESVTLIHIHNKKEDEDVRTNVELEFDPVFSAEIVDYEDSFEFADSIEPLQITITGVNLNPFMVPYLSLINPDDTDKSGSSKAPDGFNDIKHRFVDFNICPNTEIYIDDKKEKKPTTTYESANLVSALSRINRILDSEKEPADFAKENGIPTNSFRDLRLFGSSTSDILSLYSRQDELLASNEDEWPLSISIRRPGITKNWFSSKAMNSSKFGIQTTPRIYSEEHIPKSWIKGSISQSGDSYTLTFNSFDFQNIKVSSAKFSVYIYDKNHQVQRISNKPISLQKAPPEITSINSGFREDGITIYPGYRTCIDGSGFFESMKVDISGIEVQKEGFNKKSFCITIPNLAPGEYFLNISDSNLLTSEKIYISSSGDVPVFDLPTKTKLKINTTGNYIFAQNIGEIPLSYDSPSSQIELVTKKFTFLEETSQDMKAFLYITTNNIGLINFISNDYSKIGTNTYIINDIKWTLNDGDFVKKSLRRASLKFMGSQHTNRPLECLLNFKNIGDNDVGVFVTTEPTASSINSTNSLKASFKSGDLPFFSSSPAIIGMAGSTDDFGTELNYFRNFEISSFNGSEQTAIQSSILSAFSINNINSVAFGPIKSISTISKLIVFFKSVKSDFPQKYSFYIGGKKVSIFDLQENQGEGFSEKIFEYDSYAIHKVIITNVSTESLSGSIPVIIKRKDRRRRVELSSENLYFDITSPNDIDTAEKVVNGNNTQYLLTKNLLLRDKDILTENDTDALNPFAADSLFGIGTPSSGLFGNVIETITGQEKTIQLLDFNAEIALKFADESKKEEVRKLSSTFGPINVASTYSDAILYFDNAYEELLQQKNINDIKNNLNINFVPKELSYLPSFLKIPIGTKLYQYHKSESGDFKDNIKSFHRFKITNNATILSNQPRIVKVTPESFKGGQEVVITTEKMNTRKVKIYVNTTRAKIKDRGRDPSTGQDTITIIAPEDVDSIHLLQGKCQEIIIKPTSRTLLGAESDLGLTFVNEALKAIADSINGFIKDKMGDVQILIDKIKEKFLKFINLKLDKVNIAKELINSFCDMSFHLTAELNIYLKNFSILLIPVKVIFCIIDVICSLMNPVELAPAIVRLFECLYDLLLLLPPLAVPVLVLQLFLHLLELLECLINKIINTVAIITIIINAISETSALISGDEEVDFKYLMMLEGILLDNFLTIDADLQVLGPIAQILAIILQLMQLVFRFPCNIGPQTAEPDCGIDGTMLAGFITSTIMSDDGSLKTEYLLPVAQNKPKTSAILSDFSDKNITIAEIRSTLTGSDDIDEPVSGASVLTKSSEETFIEALNYNDENFRFDSNNNVSFAMSFSKVIKRFSEPQKVKFVFNDVGGQSLFRRRLDFSSQIDSPVTLLNASGDNELIISNTTNNQLRNIYSMLDGEEFLNIKVEDGKVYGNIKPLTLPIEVNGVTHLRTFVGIPKMLIMDELSNYYIIEENGIEFNDELKIDTIRARIINTNSAPDINYSRDSQEIEDDSGDPESVTIFKFPKIYFVDVRAASEIIQTQCSVFSINNFLFEMSNPDETTRIVEEVNDCLNSFINGISSKVRSMRAETERGKIPTPFADNYVENLGQELILCVNRGLNDICPQVINQLNTSFRIVEDKDNTPLGGFPDLVLPEEIMQGFQTDGPPLTGAREYAAGIGDSADIFVNKEATIEIIPRDSYDEIIVETYDISEKIDIQIISDETGTARIVKKEYNQKLKNVIADGSGNYYSYITASTPGTVRIKAKICNKTIQAITYAGLEDIITGDTNTGIDCVPNTAAIEEDRVIPLGAQVRVDRVLTINFIENESNTILFTSSEQDKDSSPTNSGMFAIGDK
jgi:hypothetical protein